MVIKLQTLLENQKLKLYEPPKNKFAQFFWSLSNGRSYKAKLEFNKALDETITAVQNLDENLVQAIESEQAEDLIVLIDTTVQNTKKAIQTFDDKAIALSPYWLTPFNFFTRWNIESARNKIKARASLTLAEDIFEDIRDGLNKMQNVLHDGASHRLTETELTLSSKDWDSRAKKLGSIDHGLRRLLQIKVPETKDKIALQQKANLSNTINTTIGSIQRVIDNVRLKLNFARGIEHQAQQQQKSVSSSTVEKEKSEETKVILEQKIKELEQQVSQSEEEKESLRKEKELLSEELKKAKQQPQKHQEVGRKSILKNVSFDNPNIEQQAKLETKQEPANDNGVAHSSSTAQILMLTQVQNITGEPKDEGFSAEKFCRLGINEVKTAIKLNLKKHLSSEQVQQWSNDTKRFSEFNKIVEFCFAENTDAQQAKACKELVIEKLREQIKAFNTKYKKLDLAAENVQCYVSFMADFFFEQACKLNGHKPNEVQLVPLSKSEREKVAPEAKLLDSAVILKQNSGALIGNAKGTACITQQEADAERPTHVIANQI